MNVFWSLLLILIGASSAVADPLHDAAKSGDLKLATQLLDQGANIAELDSSGEPALVIASLAGHADIVALLLDRGAKIEIRNKGGLTALHAAAYGGNLDVIKLLVSKNATAMRVIPHENWRSSDQGRSPFGSMTKCAEMSASLF